MAEISSVIPWVAMLIVFVGMAALLWRALSALHETVRLLTQLVGPQLPKAIETLSPLPLPLQPVAPAKPSISLPSVFQKIPLPQHLQPQLPALAKPAVVPSPDGPPPWYQAALQEIGFHETGNNQGIERYIQLAHCGALGDPWCAIFTNAMLEKVGVAGSRSASSQSFRHHPNFVQLDGPALGAIVVFWRGQKDSGLGHVGFYRGEDATHVWTLGGNENDMVQIEALPKSSASFGLIGYWWPKNVPLPKTGAIAMPAGSPTHIQVAPSGTAPPAAQVAPSTSVAPGGRQSHITATMFGGQASAYGGAIDDNSPGVALPLHFKGDRPLVRVTNIRTGVSVDCAIVDVGPWNTNDPYWQTNTRPQAETGTDLSGRKTNGAGIDLTLAAAKAISIDGKGLVDWEFIASPLAQPPKVT